MGSYNFHEKRGNKSLKRKSGNRGKPTIFLIVCEGKKTEPNYFKAFKRKKSSVEVEVYGEGKNTKSLVERAVELIQEAKNNKDEYYQVWCVFDKDSFSMQNFNAAFELARKENIEIAYSNEAFELWYLLHFEYLNSGISRKAYKKKLSKHLGFTYEKNDPEMYKHLVDRQPTAIKNAEQLLKNYNPPNPGKDNPSTTVHLLVQRLNKFLPKEASKDSLR